MYISDSGIHTEGAIDNGANVPASTGEPATADISHNNLPAKENNIVERAQTVNGIRVVPCYGMSQLEQEIPDEERAVEPDEDFYRMETAWDIISTPVLSNMANLQGILSNCLYAGVEEDSSGNRSVRYCQRYDNGRLSPMMEMMQASVLMAGKYISSHCPDKKCRKITRIVEDAEMEYLNKFQGDPGELLDIGEIISALYNALPALPVQDDSITLHEKLELYNEIIYSIECQAIQVSLNYKSYYPLTDDNILGIASTLKMRKPNLLKKLSRYGLLYLTQSSRGYQSNVRIKYPDRSTDTEWRYCLVKMNYIAGTDEPDTECSYDF